MNLMERTADKRAQVSTAGAPACAYIFFTAFCCPDLAWVASR